MTDYKALYEQANELDKDELVSSVVSMEVNIMKLKEEINHKNQKFIEWIEENKELKEENAELRKKLEHKEDKIEDHLASCNFYEEQCQELKQEIKELKVHFNLIIELIKGCKTKEQLQKLKELGTLN